MMLDTAKTKFQDAMDLLDKIKKKQKSLDRRTYKILDETLPSKEMPQKKWENKSKGKL